MAGTTGPDTRVQVVTLGRSLGLAQHGGSMVTSGGLVFIGAAMDNYLRAFDLETGSELWKGSYPPEVKRRP